MLHQQLIQSAITAGRQMCGVRCCRCCCSVRSCFAESAVWTGCRSEPQPLAHRMPHFPFEDENQEDEHTLQDVDCIGEEPHVRGVTEKGG